MGTFFGTDATTGHTHDQLNNDGSAPKVDSTAHINYSWTEFGVDVNSTYFNTPVANQKWDYCRVGNMAHIYVKTPIYGVHTSNTQFKVSPNTTWPAAIIPATLQTVGGLTLSKCDSVVNNRPGAVIIPASASTAWEFLITDNNGVLDNDHFDATNVQPKGLPYRQTFSYCVL
jgi:hypothetical protein